MKAFTVRQVIAMGAVTGMRSMTGAAALAVRRRNPAATLLSVAAIGEMLADKTSIVGNRTDRLPLAGRAMIGAAVGAFIAHAREDNAVAGAVLGAASAVAAAHLACRLRHALPGSVAAGLAEDALVVQIASRYA